VAEPARLPVGTLLELDIGAAAHGGSCVARHREPASSSGRVVFVRHTLPGERVRARVTEDRGGYVFADAVDIVRASPDRVRPPCPYAGPGRCGGCDWQHAAGPAQRALKRDIVCEQFRRLAGIDVGALLPEVRALPGGLRGWRTRTVYAVDADGRPGLRRHRSHEVEHVDRCLIGAPGVGDAAVLAERWPGLIGIEVARGDDGATATLAHRPGPARQARGRRPPDRIERVDGPRTLRHQVLEHEFRVAAEGFWQVHPAAAQVFATAVLAALQPAPGERVLDLYAGAGALTAGLAAAVGRTGSVIGIEANQRAVADAARNLADLPQAQVRRARVSAATLADLPGPVDLVVLDPPRAGAGREVLSAIVGLRPRAVGYVACDPATLARDVATARQAGWRLTSLSAFDAFPMTAHVECVAALEPALEPAQ
jgi:tRNA/tmRNA/rRNA uracil-C5-methylase (TrmA/RlmC/RlmD family)